MRVHATYSSSQTRLLSISLYYAHFPSRGPMPPLEWRGGNGAAADVNISVKRSSVRVRPSVGWTGEDRERRMSLRSDAPSVRPSVSSSGGGGGNRRWTKFEGRMNLPRGGGDGDLGAQGQRVKEWPVCHMQGSKGGGDIH